MTVQVSVLKIWDDTDSAQRPDEIVAELYDGGTRRDSVVLSKGNNWQHTWFDLAPTGDWIVREQQVPQGYTVSVERQGSRYVLTNTMEQPPEPPEVPEVPDVPEVPEVPGTPPSPGDPRPPEEPVEPEGESPGVPKLPQTGVLWWPVPVLLVSGMTLVLFGLLRRRSDDEG